MSRGDIERLSTFFDYTPDFGKVVVAREQFISERAVEVARRVKSNEPDIARWGSTRSADAQALNCDFSVETMV